MTKMSPAVPVSDPTTSRFAASDARMNESLPPTSVNPYELLVQSVMDYAIYLLTPAGRVATWNTGAQQIKGYTTDEIIGEHFSRFYTVEDCAAGVPEKALSTAAATGRFAAEGWRCRKDGSQFWAMVVVDAIRGDDGRLIGFAKITRDMTEQRQAQIAALESERRFRLLVQGVTDYAIYMLSPEGLVTNWNAGAERIKGYSSADVIGRHFSCFYTPEDIAAGRPEIALVTARREGRYEAEGWRCRKDGSRFWANAVVDAIFDGEALVGFAKITRDLTERRAAQIELEKSREQLFQAQKMEALGQLTGGLAHDFNNLLTGISGSLELLKKRVAQGKYSELGRYLAGAEGAADRAAALTHRLLAFARRQTLEPRPVNPNTLVADMENLIRRTVGPEIRVETALVVEVWSILCDPNQLENALLNLCINARDAMPQGGGLVIGTANVRVEEQHGRELELTPGQYVSVCVDDTGAGIAPDLIKRVFDPFFTTKPLGQGTGLGLSMVYGFATQSGGQLRIASEVGKGTNVCIYLPRYEGETLAEATPSTLVSPSPAKADGTVLVVDDESTVRALVAEALQELGYSTIEAANGTSGLKLLESNVRIDLLVTDVGLPGGLNGRQMADAARNVRPGLKVLFMTGYVETVAIGENCMEPGMHLITKPFSLDVLTARVAAILETGAMDR